MVVAIADLSPDGKVLLLKAREAALTSYSPYSKFRVGSALQMEGNNTIYKGCNVENASYGLAICAERNAIFQAIATGGQKLRCIAVSCIDADDSMANNSLMPCGACRQVMREFSTNETRILVDRVGSFSMEDLLPCGFSLN
jgi:cytidine deaminase